MDWLIALWLLAVPIDPPGTVDPAAEHAYAGAVQLRREGRHRDAAEAFEALAAAHPSSRLAPRALAAAGSLYQWQLAEPARAARLYDRVIAAPDHVPGRMLALNQRLAIERERSGAKAELVLIDRLYDDRKKGELAPYLLLRASHLLAGELKQPERALIAARRLVEFFAHTSWWDEGELQVARLLRRTGRPAEALPHYRRLISTRRPSFIVGEYDSDLLDEAYFELAETLEKELQRGEDAERAYLNLVRELPESIWVDDALHAAARVARARGDQAAAEAHRQRLRALRPASRWLKE